MEEIWEDINGYEGKYQVSDLGNARSLNFHREGYMQNLTTKFDKDGYVIVGLRINGKQKMEKIHRLVATAFLPNPNNYSQVHHINGIKNDNRKENLKWINPAKHKQTHSNLNEDDIVEIFRLYNVEKWYQWKIAKHFGISQTQVGAILRRIRWSTVDIPAEYL